MGFFNQSLAQIRELFASMTPAARITSGLLLGVIVVSFGSPYLSTRLPKVDAYVCAFGWRDESARAAAHALVDDNKAVGVLPVTLPGGPKVGELMTSPH